MVKLFQENIFTRFGTPRFIINNKGTYFYNRMFAAVFTMYRNKYKVATIYHPQKSDQTDLSNREIKRILKKVVNLNRNDQSTRVNDSLWAYNTAYKTPLDMSSYRIIYGKAYNLPFAIRAET